MTVTEEPTGRTRAPKTVLTLLLFGVGAALPYAVPSLGRFRIVRDGELAVIVTQVPRVPLVRRIEPEGRERTVRPAEEPRPAVIAESRTGDAGGRPVAAARPRDRSIEPLVDADVSIEDEAEGLNAFFASLQRTERREPGAVTRISHFGDSPLTGDLISGEARVRLQRAYGDAGHGFVLAGRPWGWYGHNGVTLTASGWKPLSPLLTWGDGGLHGLGAVSFVGNGSGRSEIALDGGTFTHLEVTFLTRPGGGHLLVSVDDGPPAEIDSNGPVSREGHFTLHLPKEARRVVLRSKGDGPVSVHGVVLERDGPGIVYDALGANGAAVHSLTLLNAEGWIQSLAARRSDLVILNYGTNESGYEGVPGTRYRKDWIEVIARVRKALPGASILLMSPMDRGMRREDGAIVTFPSIPRIVEAQRSIAAETGCAFFDTFSAMGGEGTMARWYDREPRLVSADFTHTTKGGSDRVARLLVGALEEAYREWQGENVK